MTRDRALLGWTQHIPALYDVLGILLGLMLVANSLWELRPKLMTDYVIVRWHALLVGFILAVQSWTAYKYDRVEQSSGGER